MWFNKTLKTVKLKDFISNPKEKYILFYTNCAESTFMKIIMKNSHYGLSSLHLSSLMVIILQRFIYYF